VPEFKIEHADARDGADNPANGVGDIVVGAGRMVDAIPPATRGASLAHTHLAKKVSHGDVAKLPYIFSYLTAAFEASPAQAITNCDKPT